MVSTLWYCFQFIPVGAQGDWPSPGWGFESKLETGELGDGAKEEVEGNFLGCLLRVSPSKQIHEIEGGESHHVANRQNHCCVKQGRDAFWMLILMMK